MEFTDIQQKMVYNALAYGKRHDIAIDQEFALVKLFEEVGEFAQAVMIHKQKCRKKKIISKEDSHKLLGQELADIIGFALLNAHLLEIDIEQAINKKWINKEKNRAPENE